MKPNRIAVGMKKIFTDDEGVNKAQFTIFLCLAVAALAWGINPAYSGGNVQKDGFNDLGGSRQGQSVGFVDVDGDGIGDMIVGAPYAVSSSNTGTVIMYRGNVRGDFSSSPSMFLAGDDNYGYSFVNMGDVDGDGKEDFAVGAIHGDGNDVSLSGSVTVYEGGKNWNYNKGLGKVIAKLSGVGPMDKFGLSVAAGDLNGDGKKDLIAGAPFNTNDPALYQGGAAYVYFAPDFSRKIVLHASSLNKGLGMSAAAGDLNGDAITDMCISASGRVLCYYGSQNFNPSIDVPDTIIRSGSSGFGKALAMIGDLNGDGYGEIVIGAPNAVISGNRDTGSIYIVKGGTGKRNLNVDVPSSDLIVRINGMALFDRFGSSIAQVGDIDGDRKPDFAVGAPMADAGPLATLVGKVYFFKGNDINTATTLENATFFEGNSRSQGYGTALAASQNGRLLIGAPRTNMDTGAVFIVDLTKGLRVHKTRQELTGENGHAQMTGSVFAAEASDFSSEGRKLQPAPSGHIPGKDNGPGKGTHNAGEECAACHRLNGKAPVVFTMSGTLYEDRAGRKPLQGGEVILEDINGNVISMTSNEVGNFWTYAPVASNPFAIASHGGMTDTLYYYDEQGNLHPADPNDSRSWQYKAWVRNGDSVRHMVTIAPVGGATDPGSRMSCSMHHGCMGTRGALWGSGNNTLPSYPPSHPSFKKHILPITRNKCAPCHIPGETWTRMVTRSDFESDPPTMVDYSGGLDLTAYNGSTVTVNNKTWTKKGIKDMTAGYEDDPDSSPVLSKTIRQQNGSIIHPGGAFWSPDDADYRVLRQWIAEGAPDN